MSTAITTHVNHRVGSTLGANSSAALPNIEIHFSSLYAWLLIIFGAIFFVLGLFMASPAATHSSPAIGILICVLSFTAILGGNYWRHHLPVVVRMTQRQLFLPRGVVTDWTNITAIDKQVLAISRNAHEYVCFKLKNPPTQNNRVNQVVANFMKNTLLNGYDVVINPQDELLRSADWFIAECRKRMSAASSKYS